MVTMNRTEKLSLLSRHYTAITLSPIKQKADQTDGTLNIAISF